MALHVRVDVPPVPELIEALVEGLVCLDVAIMRLSEDHGVVLPSLYESGIVYRREPYGREWWESASDLLDVVADHSGDCEDLAAYRAAELRYFAGEHARAVVRPTKNGKFHCLVEREDGSIEDPSMNVLRLESAHTGVPITVLAKKEAGQ